MNRRDLLAGLGALAIIQQTGCAYLFSGPKAPLERSDQIMWGFVILDLLFVGLLVGLIFLYIDFSSGAVYRRLPPQPANTAGNKRKRNKNADGAWLDEEPVVRMATEAVSAEKLNLCPEGTQLLLAGGPRAIRRNARRFARHVAHCAHCAAQLQAPAPVVTLDIEGQLIADAGLVASTNAG